MASSDGWAVLSYRTENIGDDIQSLAARRLLPATACTIDRDSGTLQCLAPHQHERHRLLANGWYSHNPSSWPWSKDVLPLLTSVHLSPNAANAVALSARNWCLRPELRDYLRHWGPVGARDLSTHEALLAAGVPSFMSGCLTLTLPENRGSRVSRTVLVDVPKEILAAAAPFLPGEVRRETHTIDVTLADADRQERAEDLVGIYASSQLILTTRLHAALPAMAAGTPVLLIDVGQVDGRFAGFSDLLTTVRPREEDTDWGRVVSAALAQPPQPAHSSLRDGIRAHVAAWLEQRDLPAPIDTDGMRAAAALAEARERGVQLKAVSAERDRLTALLEEERAAASAQLQAERAASAAQLQEARSQADQRLRFEAAEHRERLELEREVARQRLQEHEARREELELRLQTTKADLKRVDAELAAVHASTSWHVTAPMRRVRDALRRV